MKPVFSYLTSQTQWVKIVGVIGADGLRFLAVFWNGLTVFSRKSGRFNGSYLPQWFPGFFTKND